VATQLNIDKIASDNPRVDLRQLKEGQDLLESLQQSGSVSHSGYGLDTPESKREIRPTSDQEALDCLPAHRRLR
jgi:hypothetical protein